MEVRWWWKSWRWNGGGNNGAKIVLGIMEIKSDVEGIMVMV